MNSSKKIIFENFELYLHNQGYYEIIISDNGDFSFDELANLIEAQRVLGEKKLPVIVICGAYSSTDVEFTKHLAKNENNPYSLADAFVLKSIAQKLVANFYTKIVVPERPTKFFNSREDAFNWITQYMQ